MKVTFLTSNHVFIAPYFTFILYSLFNTEMKHFKAVFIQ